LDIGLVLLGPAPAFRLAARRYRDAHLDIDDIDDSAPVLVLRRLCALVSSRALVQPSREKWFAIPAILLVSVGLFAQELSLIGIPGIWFPFGVGVSRTEYAYAIFDTVLLALLLRRLYSFRVLPAASNGPLSG
jgi:hypothetical protein